MDKLILQTLEKHIEDLSHESPQGIDIDSIDQLKYELTNLFSLHIVSQQRELLINCLKEWECCDEPSDIKAFEEWIDGHPQLINCG